MSASGRKPLAERIRAGNRESPWPRREGFTEDCIARFAEQPERRGRAALPEPSTWQDRETGKAMAGRRVEVWAMRDGMTAVWDAALNIWEQGGERKSPVM